MDGMIESYFSFILMLYSSIYYIFFSIVCMDISQLAMWKTDFYVSHSQYRAAKHLSLGAM